MATATKLEKRDVVVVGASAGGVEALSELAAALPRDLPAAVFVVLHASSEFPSVLPELLTRHGPLRALHPVHGEEIVPGRIYVAPPDNHLLLRPGYVHVVRGPKENGHRPSVDALFRSAAVAYGPRVIGVVLTGYLDCGTVGLLSVKARGGLAIVQDPADAVAPAMPPERGRARRGGPRGPAGRDRPAPRAPRRRARARAAPGPAAGVARRDRGRRARHPRGRRLPAVPGIAHALGDGALPGVPLPRRTRLLPGQPRHRAGGGGRARAVGGGPLARGERGDHPASPRDATGDLQRKLAEKEDAQVQQADVIRQILLSGRAGWRAPTPAASAPDEPAG